MEQPAAPEVQAPTKKRAISQRDRAKLHVNVSTARNELKRLRIANKYTRYSAIIASCVVQVVAKMLAEASSAQSDQLKRIKAEHVVSAVEEDPDLSVLFKGGIPIVPSETKPKKTKKKEENGKEEEEN